MKSVFLTVATIASISNPASAEEAKRIKVAVVPGLAVNLDAARVDALNQDLAEALVVDLDVEAIGGLEVRRLLPAEGIPPDCVANTSCIADVAKRLSADQLLFVVMVDTGTTGAIQIDTTWVEAASGATASRPAIDLANVADAKAKFLANARRLLPDAPLRKQPPDAGVGGGVRPPDGTMTTGVPRHFTTPAYVAMGGVAVGLGVAAGFGLTARSRWHACKEVACSEERQESVDRLSMIADLGHVVWVGSAIAVAALYFTSGEEPRYVLVPQPEGGASAAIVGRF